MTSGPRKGALVAGLILMVVGVIFFLEIWYEQFSILRLIGRYWPVILILVGVMKIYNYFTWKEPPSVPDSGPKE
jgi:uncharacterized membrane protein HdeD (DUF308 family)